MLALSTGLVMIVRLQGTQAIPADPFYFEQVVDHFAEPDGATFMQRYYKNDTWFGGPGSPILCIIGGEGAVPPSTGIFYPFVTDVLAQRFSALVLEPEHRFYGESMPFGDASLSSSANLALATPQQALEDAVHFIQETQASYGCTARGTPGYCPVITIGGSYPGWLSAMLRLRYPAVIDGAYAASAPMLFYSQEVDQYAYYSVVTSSAEKSVPGCAAQVRQALASLVGLERDEAVAELGLCEPLPAYIDEGDDALFYEEVLMVFMYTFANLNMGNYPPSGSQLEESCSAFVDTAPTDPLGALRQFLHGYGVAAAAPAQPYRRAGVVAGKRNKSNKKPHRREHAANTGEEEEGDDDDDNGDDEGSCFDLSTQLPSGHDATISGGDWSGCGSGDDGMIWDLETCGYLVEAIGANNVTDMFPPRAWTLDWLSQHCADRFNGTAPAPMALADAWGFSSSTLESTGATRILFTNGLNDGWSAGGITYNVSEEKQLLAINMENGAHHSDLSHFAPDPEVDTPDVTAARKQIEAVLLSWLEDL